MRPVLALLSLMSFSVAHANQPSTNDELDDAINRLMANHSPISFTKPNLDTYQENVEKYYPNQDLSDKPNVRIGMTAFDVRYNSNWGEPSEISTIINQFGTQEIWIYGKWDKLLHLTNNKVTHIQYWQIRPF